MRIFLISGAALAAVLLVQGCEPGGGDATTAAAPEAEVPVVEQASSSSIDAVLAGEHRSAENKARDKYRHPGETLEFFGIQPDSSVIEIWPGGGWYTEILAPYLRDNGRYIAAGFDPNSEIEFIAAGAVRFREMLDANPDVYGKVETTILMPPTHLEMVPPGSVDAVLTFRSVHNWMPRNMEGMVLDSMFAALKSGGVLGIVEHRGIPGTEQDPGANTGYVNQDYAIALAEAAGFVFDASSEINANPADTKDHPEGVWTLPPTLRLKDQDRDKYLGIGESDRFTLRFIKPAE
ncbi:MAG: methyltransferase [Gammaproteobacteria bacterium]|jgi:predicted methyltransferase|nr:methyltransferase [Gammaproteobacteria bacterium]MDP6617502.1 methyltransferase [Gammaproteobacteria bacterium]MDP6695937.1 methyltransferase [Gammaproteobacteria bacterium]